MWPWDGSLRTDLDAEIDGALIEHGHDGQGANILRLCWSVARRWLPAGSVGAPHHTEFWVAAEGLEALNDCMTAPIEIVELRR